MAVLLFTALPPYRLTAQASRNWRPEDRAFLTDLSFVTAVAATRSIVYVATPNGLGLYDRGLLVWRQTVGPLDGWPQGVFTAMAADPNDDTAWLGGQARWAAYDPFTRRLESGSLPGTADQVLLDARDPGRGAYFHTGAGWYFVARGTFAATPARDVPAPGNRIGGVSARELATRLPAFDAVRFRVERDEQLRTFRLTSAALAPLTNEIFVGTDGNGAFRVDPVTYATERLPSGLLGGGATAIAFARGQLCAASAPRIRSPHHGITCFDEGLRGFTYIESIGHTALPGGTVRGLLVTERAVWAATDQGLLRAPRRGGRPVQVLSRDGLPGDQVLALAPAPTGAYVGTSGGLAVVSDTGRGVVVTASARGPAVLALAAGADDTVWAGTDAGVVGFLLPIGETVIRPDGPLALREPVVAIAAAGDTLVAATTSRLLVRERGEWRVVDPPGRPVGRIVRVSADREGFWVAGDLGVAFFEPVRGIWQALVSPADFPQPVRDIATSRDYLWVATEQGVVRFEKRILVP